MIPRPVLALLIFTSLAACCDCDAPAPTEVAMSGDEQALRSENPAADSEPATGRQEEAQEEPADEAGDAARALAREIEAQVSKLRGLEIKSPTTIGAYTEEELREFLGRKVGDSLKPDLVRAHKSAMVLLGLYQPDIDVEETVTALLAEQVAGFYEPEEKELFIIKRDDPAMAKLDRIIMAHELVHALQDQHFDLESMLAIEDDDDQISARKALVEGDATWAMLAFEQNIAMARLALPRMPDSLSAFMTLVERAKKMGMGGMIDAGTLNLDALQKTPAVDADDMIFSYYGGAKFCLHLLQVEGNKTAINLERLDRAFREPPSSTEQVLHPEKYDVARDEPSKVVLPDLLPTLGEGWKRLGTNTLGELRMRTLFTEAEGLDAKAARAAHEGWDGDRYAVYSDGEQDFLVWASIWDSQQDASEFVRGLLVHLKSTVPYDGTTLVGFAARWNDPETDLENTLVLDEEARVLVLRHVPQGLQEAVLKQLQTETKWTRK